MKNNSQYRKNVKAVYQKVYLNKNPQTKHIHHTVLISDTLENRNFPCKNQFCRTDLLAQTSGLP